MARRFSPGYYARDADCKILLQITNLFTNISGEDNGGDQLAAANQNILRHAPTSRSGSQNSDKAKARILPACDLHFLDIRVNRAREGWSG
ncbi:hypothetical protein OIK40_11620 [Erythrobacter sp. sf7]|uniref:Uncharacterized protein n=1 Tax=Erythrobacter fulvus TaxID=2987523 RepID=A0ABT5JR99_9SPHN|nr:hypothetical protein [Erythrobacter fulvus]MDC8755288.1 hypothetical protein [Erythrobacter fulvus]